MSEDHHPTDARPDPIAGLVGHPAPTPIGRYDTYNATVAIQRREIDMLCLALVRAQDEIARLHRRNARLLAQNRALRLTGPRWWETLLACLVALGERLPRHQGGWAISDSPLPRWGDE